jgi:hypothetical protein
MECSLVLFEGEMSNEEPASRHPPVYTGRELHSVRIVPRVPSPLRQREATQRLS